MAASAFARVVAVAGDADWHVDPLKLFGWIAMNVLVVAMTLGLRMLLLNRARLDRDLLLHSGAVGRGARAQRDR